MNSQKVKEIFQIYVILNDYEVTFESLIMSKVSEKLIIF